MRLHLHVQPARRGACHVMSMSVAQKLNIHSALGDTSCSCCAGSGSHSGSFSGSCVCSAAPAEEAGGAGQLLAGHCARLCSAHLPGAAGAHCAQPAQPAPPGDPSGALLTMQAPAATRGSTEQPPQSQGASRIAHVGRPGAMASQFDHACLYVPARSQGPPVVRNAQALDVVVAALAVLGSSKPDTVRSFLQVAVMLMQARPC